MQANPVQTSAANVTSVGNEAEVMNKKYTILYERLAVTIRTRRATATA
jgi:hypothetical protein